jgi:hypothetical protein
MSLARDWRGTDNYHKQGQADILEIGWTSVQVKRIVDTNRHVGTYAELDNEDEFFVIKARIDPMNSLKEKKWIGKVEDHILPMMRKNDRWYVQKPNDSIEVYKVESIDSDEIMLERV